MNEMEQMTQYGMRLCNAVKTQRCIYDPQSVGYRLKNITTAAWKTVAQEINDTPTNCRFRWKSIRTAFTRSYKKDGNKSDYYLYTHMLFLTPFLEMAWDKSNESIMGDECNKSIMGDECNKSIMGDECNKSIMGDDCNRSIMGDECNNKSLLAMEKVDNGIDSDSEITKSAEESQGILTPVPGQDITNGIKNETQQQLEKDRKQNKDFTGKVTSTTTMTDRRRVAFQNNIEKKEEKINGVDQTNGHEKSSLLDPSQAFENIDSGSHESPVSDEFSGRRLRDRKTPKRFIDMDFSTEKSNETKRPRRIVKRRQSVGGLMLKEFAFKQSESEFMHSPNNEVFRRRMPVLTPEIPTFCDTTINDVHGGLKHNFKSLKDDTSSLSMPPKVVDNFTITESSKNYASVGTQSECMAGGDNEFLESLKPQMLCMNLRQKVNFKRQVYQALMNVLDDGTNFPQDDVILEAASTVAADFSAITSSELILMRELVSLVQSAKTTPELRGERAGAGVGAGAEAAAVTGLEVALPTASQTNCSPSTTTLTPSPSLACGENYENQIKPTIMAKNFSPVKNMPQQSTNASVAATTTTVTPTHTLGIPRHVIQKAVKVAGSGVSTIMTQMDGEKKRVYRIYPKNCSNAGALSSPQPVAQVTTAKGSQGGTFFVSPQTPPVHSPLPTIVNKPIQTTNAAPNQQISYKTPYFTPPTSKRVVNTNTNSMLPPSNNNKSLLLVNNVNKHNVMTPPAGNGMLNQTQNKLMQRRSSICGPIPTRPQHLGVQQRLEPKPYTRVGSNNPHLAALQKGNNKLPPEQEMRQLLHMQQQQQHQLPRIFSRTSPGPPTFTQSSPITSKMSTIQMSKPVSLYSAASNGLNPHPQPLPKTLSPQSTKVIPAINDNCRPRIPQNLQPGPANTEQTNALDPLSTHESSLLDMASTIAADNFGSVFSCKPIKAEPEE